MSDGLRIPSGYEPLESACERFLTDHPDPRKNVFIMTRYVAGDRLLETIDGELRTVLSRHGLVPLRADDKMYPTDRSLWDNVCVYMICCGLGVAILEDRLRDEFNPNIALEYGFMRALDKPVLLLADRGFRNLRADVIGTLRAEFDITDIEATLRDPVKGWLRDLGIAEDIQLPAGAKSVQQAAELWRVRLEKIRAARDAQERNDEFWYFGQEVDGHRALFQSGVAGSRARIALHLADQAIHGHDDGVVRRLLDLLGDVVVGAP